MPKPVSPPTPAYGSPEWKAMRAQMVGTPEYYASGVATPQQEFKFYVDLAVQQAYADGKIKDIADEAKYRTAAEEQYKSYLAPLAPGQAGGKLGQLKYTTDDHGIKQYYNPVKFGITTPANVTLTTAEKQAQNPLYNPLYDPGSVEYKANLQAVSNPNQKPATTTPKITNPNPLVQNPLAPPSVPSVQIPAVSKPASAPIVNTANLTQAVQSQNQVTTPNNPLVKLPDIFQQSTNPTPSPYSPIASSVKMPNLNKKAGFNTNWSDLFNVAQNQFTR